MTLASAARLVALGAALLGAFSAALFTGDSKIASVWLAAAGLLWWATCVRAGTLEVSRRWLWGIALGMRLLAFATGPRFSDDIYRYLWEGEVILEGRSPYSLAPDSPRLAELRARLPGLQSRVNHPEVPAAYPPLVQACGTIAALADRAAPSASNRVGLLGLRLLFLGADLLLLGLLVRAAGCGLLRPEAGIVWGWCPLVCLEFAGSGHLDSLGILWLTLALLVVDERSLRAALFTGLGIATKFLPVVLLPWLWRTGAGRKAWARPLLALAVGVAGFVPFALLAERGAGLDAGLQVYGERWEASSMLYRFVEPFVREHLVAADAPFESARHLARVLAGLAWCAFAGWTILRVTDPWRGCGRLVGAFLVLSPTLHPWYLLWMLPFLARSSSGGWSWMIAVAGLMYWPLDGWVREHAWIEPSWLWWTTVPVFASLCAWELLEPWRGARREAD